MIAADTTTRNARKNPGVFLCAPIDLDIAHGYDHQVPDRSWQTET